MQLASNASALKPEAMIPHAIYCYVMYVKLHESAPVLLTTGGDCNVHDDEHPHVVVQLARVMSMEHGAWIKQHSKPSRLQDCCGILRLGGCRGLGPRVFQQAAHLSQRKHASVDVLMKTAA